MGTLNLRVLIQAVDRATGPLRRIVGGLNGLTKPGRAAGLVIRDLGGDLKKMAMVGAAAMALLAGGLWTVIQRTADAGDAALLASQKTGVQIESYQRLAYAAGLANVASEEFDNGLKFLNQSIDAAGRGSKQDARAFTDLGIRLKGANGEAKSTEAVLREVADRFKSLPDGPRKTAIAMALFGRSGVDMIPMLNEGGDALKRWGEEAQAAGLVMSEQAARDADEFNDSLDRLKGGAMGLAVSIGSGLLPQLTPLIEKARQFILANKPEIIAQMTKVVGELAEAAPALISALLAIVKLIAALAKIVGPIVKALGGFGAVLDILAGIMIGRLAVAIWMAVKAVWGLNAAFYANPVGLVIAGIAALIFAGWLLYRNWDKVVAFIKRAWSGIVTFFQALGGKMKAAFKSAVDALWQMLPAWLRTLFRVGSYTVRVVGQGLNGRGPGGGAPRPAAPRPAVGAADRGRNDRLDVNLRVAGGRPVVDRVAASSPGTTVNTSTYRGGYGD